MKNRVFGRNQVPYKDDGIPQTNFFFHLFHVTIFLTLRMYCEQIET